MQGCLRNWRCPHPLLGGFSVKGASLLPFAFDGFVDA